MYKHCTRCHANADDNGCRYVPAQYDPSQATNLMVCFDGGGYVSPEGHNVPLVMDNLIHAKELPVTVRTIDHHCQSLQRIGQSRLIFRAILGLFFADYLQTHGWYISIFTTIID